MLNFSVIGVGSFGIKRAKAIQESNNANLVSICDVNLENANKAKNILKVEVQTFDKILKDDNIHVICICTPNKFHLPIIKEALNSGKHVFCEKPLCRDLKEAETIYDLSKKSKTIFQMGSNHRYFESVMYAKKLVNNNEIGDVLSFTGRIGHDGERLKNSWFWDKELSGGGTLLDNGCHLLELSRYFMGDFTSGGGSISNSYWKNISVEDTANGFFSNQRWKNCIDFLFLEIAFWIFLF